MKFTNDAFEVEFEAAVKNSVSEESSNPDIIEVQVAVSEKAAHPALSVSNQNKREHHDAGHSPPQRTTFESENQLEQRTESIVSSSLGDGAVIISCSNQTSQTETSSKCSIELTDVDQLARCSQKKQGKLSKMADCT